MLLTWAHRIKRKINYKLILEQDAIKNQFQSENPFQIDSLFEKYNSSWYLELEFRKSGFVRLSFS